jgi:hypothetical protein
MPQPNDLSRSLVALEGNRNPRDIAASPDCLIAPAMQHGKQPFWARLELLTRLAFDAGKNTANRRGCTWTMFSSTRCAADRPTGLASGSICAAVSGVSR